MKISAYEKPFTERVSDDDFYYVKNMLANIRSLMGDESFCRFASIMQKIAIVIEEEEDNA